MITDIDAGFQKYEVQILPRSKLSKTCELPIPDAFAGQDLPNLT